MPTKICSDCKEEKEVSEFYKNKTANGFYYSSICKKCAIKRANAYRKSRNETQIKNDRIHRKKYRQRAKRDKSQWSKTIYRQMRQRNKKKFDTDLNFTVEEFESWLHENYEEEFNSMFDAYVDSDYDKMKKPSIDRIDDYKGYTFDNMQLLTWEENNIKGRNGLKNKISCAEVAVKYCSKPVIQFDTDMNYVCRYQSTHEVERQTGYRSNLIARACRRSRDGHYCISKGFIWFYQEDLPRQFIRDNVLIAIFGQMIPGKEDVYKKYKPQKESEVS